MQALTRFAECESGAITVDWVVLTSGLCVLGLAVANLISSGVEEPSEGISSQMAADIVGMHANFGRPDPAD